MVQNKKRKLDRNRGWGDGGNVKYIVLNEKILIRFQSYCTNQRHSNNANNPAVFDCNL